MRDMICRDRSCLFIHHTIDDGLFLNGNSDACVKMESENLIVGDRLDQIQKIRIILIRLRSGKEVLNPVYEYVLHVNHRSMSQFIRGALLV